VELAYYVMDQANIHMSKTLSNMDLAPMRVNARIKAGVRARLEYMIPYLTVWPQAMALGALPQNLMETARNLGIMADEIWWHAGDRSTDMNWYSRR
jgi:ubiquinone biosynthesis protein COQ9